MYNSRQNDISGGSGKPVAPLLLTLLLGFAWIGAGCSAPGKAVSAKQYKPGERRIHPARLYTRTYTAELQKAAKAYRPKPGATDKSFDYSPAVLRQVKPAEVRQDSAGNLHIAGEVLIKLRKGYTDVQLLEALKDLRVESALVGYVPAFRLVQVRLNDDSQATLEKIRQLPPVEFVRRHQVRSSDEAPGNAKPSETKLPEVNEHVWQVIDFRVNSAWPRTSGRGIRVAVIDSGLDQNVPEFPDRVVFPYSVVTRSAKFQDGVLTRKGEPLRVVDHGTAVASIIAGKTAGVAPGASIMPIQVLGYNVRNDKIITHDLAILEGLARAIEFKAHIINMSIGGDYSEVIESIGPGNIQVRSRVIKQIRQSAAHNMRIFDEAFRACKERGIPVVVSAGNDNLGAAAQPLARHTYTISVGAMGREGRRAGFSNYGPIVDTFAPGLDVAGKGAGNSFRPFSGTSFSAPYLAGVLALARALKLPGDTKRLRQAIRTTNQHVKVTVLAEEPLPVFSPVAFLNRLGAKLPPVPAGRLEANFRKKYAAFMVKPDDTPRQEMLKILGYFNERGHMYSEWPETSRLAALAGNNFEAARSIFVADNPARGEDNGAYFLMVLMQSVDLSDAQLSRLSGISHTSSDSDDDFNHDYMAALFRAKGYKKALPWMYRRLKKSPYNVQTLEAIAELGGQDAFPRLQKHLEKYHTTGPHRGGHTMNLRQVFSDQEIYTLAALTKSAGDKPGLKQTAYRLALKSYERYRRRPFYIGLTNGMIKMPGKDDRYSRFDPWMSSLAEFSRTMLSFQDRRSLLIALDALKHLDTRQIHPEKLNDYVLWYQAFQYILNQNTDFGLRYNYQVSAAERTVMRAKFRKAAENAEFRGGKFRPGRALRRGQTPGVGRPPLAGDRENFHSAQDFHSRQIFEIIYNFAPS